MSFWFQISKATISERLTDSPCALIAPMFGWSGNMERLAISNAHQKADGAERSYYLNQRKALEVNPRHPVMRHLLTRVLDDPEDAKAKDIAVMLFRTGNHNFIILLLSSLYIKYFKKKIISYQPDTMWSILSG